VHVLAVPRVGGVAIFAGWLTALAAGSYFKNLPFETIATWAFCMLPVFVAGLAEDFTKRVSVSVRLLA
jgi:UDP-N-acetylmuramyl pentapeptide phosphotransferase/UDP-N-acetylglucosamine-1-phosphate transferase